MFVRQQCDPISHISKTQKRKAKILRRKLEKIERRLVEKQINVNKGGRAFCEGFHTHSCAFDSVNSVNQVSSSGTKFARAKSIRRMIYNSGNHDLMDVMNHSRPLKVYEGVDEPPEYMYIDYSILRILRNQKGKNKIKGGNPQGKQNKTKASTINSTNYVHGSVPVFDFNCL